MNDFQSLLSSCCMEDSTLRALMDRWHKEQNQERQKKLEQTIIGIIEERERTNFIVRFLLRDYDSWHKVLTDTESNSSDAQDAKFYEPHLLAVLVDNGGQLEPIKAIQKVLDRVKDELTLADFTMTSSKRFRYDTTIRFLADSLKKRGILSNSKEYKNKVWALEPEK